MQKGIFALLLTYLMISKINFFIILLSFFTIIYGDLFYIVEKPSSLIVYDKYESRINNTSKFLPFSPFQVIDKEWELGDGISTAIKVKYLGNVYFILKDDDGNIEGKSRAGKFSVLNVISLNDTLKAKGQSQVKSGPYPGNKNISSTFGSVAEALFKYKGYYYLKNRKEKSLGWSKVSNWTKIETVKKERVDYKLNTDYVEKITARIESINGLYKKLTSYYNDNLNESKSAPYWKITKDEYVINLKLRGSLAFVRQMENSSQYIVQDILNILLGEPYSVVYRDGSIIISPEEEL